MSLQQPQRRDACELPNPVTAFIGCGNMGSAMLAGGLAAGVLDAARVRVHTKTPSHTEELGQRFGVIASTSNAAAGKDANLVILAVKPVFYPEVLTQIAPVLTPGAVVLGIAPSFSLRQLRAGLGRDDVAVARAMPNTPALVGKAATGVCFEPQTLDVQRSWVLGMLGGLGLVQEVREDQFPALIGVAGSSPAFVYMMIEAMAQGAIKLGIAATEAYRLAAAAVEGSATMVRESGKHPAVLRDEVCSAGGTTIAGVASLEAAGFAGVVIDAVQAAADRAVEMGSSPTGLEQSASHGSAQ